MFCLYIYLHPLQYSRVRRCQVGPCQGPSWLSCLVGATRGSVEVGWGRSVYGCVWKLWHPYIQKWIAIRIELPSELKPAIPIENQATPIRILPLGLGPMGSPGLNGSHFAINVDGGGRYICFFWELDGIWLDELDAKNQIWTTICEISRLFCVSLTLKRLFGSSLCCMVCWPCLDEPKPIL